MDPTAAVPAPDTRHHRALAAQSRVDLLDSLQRAGRPLSAPEAAELVGLHPNTARVHLERLVAVGLVVRDTEPRTAPGRPRTLYAPAPTTTPPSPGPPAEPSGEGYRALAAVLASELESVPDARRAAVEAGRRWAAATGDRSWPDNPDAAAAVAAVVDLLADLGFRPEVGPDGQELLLRRCPFEEVAREHRGVVCGVHLGLLEGTFDRVGGPVHVAGLEPFRQDQPQLCAVRLQQQGSSPASPAAGPGATLGDAPTEHSEKTTCQPPAAAPRRGATTTRRRARRSTV